MVNKKRKSRAGRGPSLGTLGTCYDHSLLLALVHQAGRRVAAALAFRDFRLLWFGALVSSIGTWMQKVAQAWLIVTLTGTSSAFFLGLDSFVGELPILLLIFLILPIPAILLILHLTFVLCSPYK